MIVVVGQAVNLWVTLHAQEYDLWQRLLKITYQKGIAQLHRNHRTKSPP
jgi:hypothetical protein